jgi:translocation and assembly module TamB
MSRRWLKWLIGGVVSVVLLVGLVAAGAYWTAMHTEAGARWMFRQAVNAAPGRLAAGSIEGDLGSGLTIERLAYEDGTVAVTADRLAVRAGIDFRPLTLRIRALDAREVQVRLPEQDDPPRERRESDLQGLLKALQLPVAVAIERADVAGLALIGPDGEEAYRADRVSLAGRMADRLEIGRLEIAAAGLELDMDGALDLEEPFPAEARIRARLDSDGFGRADARADISGELDRFQALLTAELDGIDAGAQKPLGARVDVRGEGSLAGFRVETLDIAGEALRLNGSGAVDWAAEPAVTFDVVEAWLAPEYWSGDWPAGEALEGRVSGRLTSRDLVITDAEIGHAGGDARLDLQGRYDSRQGVVEGRLDWRDLRWPLVGAVSRIESREGGITLTGSPADWRLEGGAALAGEGAPEGGLTLAAQGDRDCARVPTLEGAVLGGEVRGEAEVCWGEDGRVRSELTARGLDTGILIPGWPGRIDIQAGLSGRTDGRELTVDIRRFEGELRDYPVQGSGTVSMQNEDVELRALRLQSGSSTISVDGRLGSAAGLAFTADVQELESLLPGSSGRIRGEGALSLDPSRPRLDLELEASGLSIEGLSVGSLMISNAPNAGERVADLLVTAEALSYGGQSFDSARGRLSLGDRVQQAQLELQRESERFGMALSGESSVRIGGAAFQWGDLAESRWAGAFDSLVYELGDQLSLSLARPAPLSLAADASSIEAACVTPGGDASLCMDAAWARGAPLSLSADLQQLPLSLLRPWLGEELRLTQQLDGSIEGQWAPGKEPSARLVLKMSPGRIGLADREDALLNTGQGRLDATLLNGRVSAGRFELPLEDDGVIDLDFEVPDVRGGSSGAIDGRVQLLLTDLDIVNHFVDGLDEISGRFESDLRLGGTWTRPLLSGQTRISEGVVENYGLGLRFTDIVLEGRTDGAAITELNGQFQAREGLGRLTALVDLGDLARPRMELQLKGEGLVLMDAPDLRVVSSPDLRLSWSDDTLEVGGRLFIPSARVAPRSIPGSTVAESPDRVIVAGEIPGSAAPSKAPASDLRVRGNFDLVLGDDVSVDLSVATAQLGGQANFAWRDSPQPIVNGGLELVGQIQAFGQSLRITDGKIAWTDSPAANPHLNIRAERQIYGNSEVRRAGVFVTGTLRRLVIEPFTDPMTDRERARTLLVTGSDFNMEKGVGAVNVGTYIAPRLFVSYGIGVFEDDNVLGIRFDLTRTWGVKATSGQRGTGVDIVYTIEH